MLATFGQPAASHFFVQVECCAKHFAWWSSYPWNWKKWKWRNNYVIWHLNSQWRWAQSSIRAWHAWEIWFWFIQNFDVHQPWQSTFCSNKDGRDSWSFLCLCCCLEHIINNVLFPFKFLIKTLLWLGKSKGLLTSVFWLPILSRGLEFWNSNCHLSAVDWNPSMTLDGNQKSCPDCEWEEMCHQHIINLQEKIEQDVSNVPTDVEGRKAILVKDKIPLGEKCPLHDCQLPK